MLGQHLEPGNQGGDAKIRAVPSRLCQKRREGERREILETGEGHRGRDVAPGGEAGQIGEDCLRPVEEGAAETRGAHRATGPAQEQGLAQMRLQLGECHRQRGLRDMERACSQAHAFMAGDGGGIFELAQGYG